MNDLSHDIKHARQLLSHIEILDNNPHYLTDGDYPWGHIWSEH